MKRLAVLAFSMLLFLPQARAEMIDTPEVERERVKSMLERPETKAEMQKMGVAPADAAARVDAMTAEEVRSLAGRLDQLPAGGRVSDQTLLIIIILILLIVIIA